MDAQITAQLGPQCRLGAGVDREGVAVRIQLGRLPRLGPPGVHGQEQRDQQDPPEPTSTGEQLDARRSDARLRSLMSVLSAPFSRRAREHESPDGRRVARPGRMPFAQRLALPLALSIALLAGLCARPSTAQIRLFDEAPAPRTQPRVPESRVKHVREAYRRHFEEVRAHGRLGPEPDIARLLDLITEGLRRGADLDRIAGRAAAEGEKMFFSFTEAGATHDPEAIYALPFDPSTPRLLSYGPGESDGHQAEQHHSYDFALPIGTPVLAARPGVVARVIHGFTEGGLRPEFKGRGNAVFVLHEDGSFAEYVHLLPEGLARIGDRVEAGQRVGLSGSTGYSSGPHLHFSVLVLRAPGQKQSVPIRFAIGGETRSALPRAQFYP